MRLARRKSCPRLPCPFGRAFPVVAVIIEKKNRCQPVGTQVCGKRQQQPCFLLPAARRGGMDFVRTRNYVQNMSRRHFISGQWHTMERMGEGQPRAQWPSLAITCSAKSIWICCKGWRSPIFQKGVLFFPASCCSRFELWFSHLIPVCPPQSFLSASRSIPVANGRES